MRSALTASLATGAQPAKQQGTRSRALPTQCFPCISYGNGEEADQQQAEQQQGAGRGGAGEGSPASSTDQQQFADALDGLDLGSLTIVGSAPSVVLDGLVRGLALLRAQLGSSACLTSKPHSTLLAALMLPQPSC